MATDISLNGPLFCLWVKGQLMVILSGTKTAYWVCINHNPNDTKYNTVIILQKSTKATVSHNQSNGG